MKISTKRIGAIFIKECKDAKKCPPVLIAFFMVPLLAFMIKNLLPDAGTEMIFSMFYPMHVVLSGLLSCSSIMAEEKERNTLRVLIMNRVKPMEYILGIGIFVFLGQMLGALIFIILAGISSDMILPFIGITIIGNICSILLGSLVGVVVKNQISVAPVAVPLMLLLTFIPILSTGNESIKKIGKIFYSQQISNLINNVTNKQPVSISGILIMVINLVLFFIIFVIAYNKNSLDNL